MKALKPSSSTLSKILRKKLKDDLEDEDEAIESYGQRLSEAKGFPVAKKKLQHILTDEKEHKRKIGSILKLKRP